MMLLLLLLVVLWIGWLALENRGCRVVGQLARRLAVVEVEEASGCRGGKTAFGHRRLIGLADSVHRIARLHL